MEAGSPTGIDDTTLAERLEVEPEQLRDARAAATRGRIGSLDRTADPNQQPHDVIADRTAPGIEEALESRELHGYLRGALDSLPDRLRLIVVGHYLDGQPLERIADTLGLTPSRVSQLRADAIEILRHGIEAQFDGDTASGPDATPPKGRVAIRQAQFAASVARHSDWRARLAREQYGSGLARPTSEVSHSA
jgi:RNA polymerase sigma factor for flagellar operon FliA